MSPPPDDLLAMVSDDPAEQAFEDVMTLSPRQKLRFLQLLKGLLTEPVQADASTGSTAEIAPEDFMQRQSQRGGAKPQGAGSYEDAN